MLPGEGQPEVKEGRHLRRWRRTRRVFLSIVAACVLLVVAAALVSQTAGFRRFATSLLTGTVRKHTGRELTIGQMPVLRLGLRPAVVARDVGLSFTVGTEPGETVHAREIEFEARLLPLLRGRIAVKRLAIDGLDVIVATKEEPKRAEAPEVGAEVARPPLTKGLSSLLSRLDVGELRITDSSLIVHDRASGQQTRLAIEHLRLARNLLAPEELRADVSVALKGVPLSLSGSFGGLGALVSDAKPFPLKVVVATEGGRAVIEGVIRRVWTLEGLDLGVRVEVTDPAALGRVLGARLPGGARWRVEGRLQDVESGYSVEPLTVVFAANTVTGRVQLTNSGTGSATLAGSSVEVGPLLAALGVRSGVSGRVGEVAADVQTKGRTPRDWVANLAGQVGVTQGSVVVGARTQIEVERADVAAKAAGGLDVEVTGRVGGVPLSVSGMVGTVEALAFGGKPLPVHLRVGTDGATVGIEGRVGGTGTSLKLSGSGIELAPLLAALGVKSGVSGRVGEVAADVQTKGGTPRDWVANLAGQVRVTQGSVVVGGGTRIGVERAGVTSNGGGLGVEAMGSVGGVPLTVAGTVGSVEALAFGGRPFPVDVVAKTDGGTASIEGVIAHLWSLSGVDIGVRAEVTDPGALGRVLGAGLPGRGPWRLEGRIKDEEGRYALDPMQVVLGGNTVAGAIQLGGAEPASLKLSGSGIELEPLLAALGVKSGVSGRVGEVAADVQTKGGTPRDWVANLAGQVRVTQGSVVVGESTRVEVERANVVSETGGLGVEAVGSVGGVPLTVTGAVGSVEALAFGGRPFPVDVVAKTDGGTAAIDGEIGRVWAFKDVDLGVRTEVSDPATLGCVLGVGLPGGGPWRVEGRVRDTGAGFAVDPLAVVFSGNTVTGRVGIDRSAARLKVTTELSAAALDLSAGSEPAEPEEARTDQAPSPTKEGPIFSSSPLPLHGLEAADGQVALWFQRLARRERAEIGELTLRAVLADGSLVVEPIELRTAGGTIKGSVRIDASGDVSAKLTGDAIQLGALVTVLGGATKATGGTTSLHVDLQSAGRSLHDWMANLRGAIRIVTGPGRLEGKKIDLGLGVMSKVMELINPFHKEDKHTDLRCAVVNASVEKGVVDLAERVVIETEKFTAIASGTVDLGREVLDLDVYSKAALSLSAGVSNFAGIVKMSGSLSKPSFSLAAQGAATTALSVGGAVATGGLSLLGEDLLNKILRRAHCKDALAGPAPAPGGTRTAKGQ